MERIYKLDLKRIVSVMDIFDGQIPLRELLGYSVPFTDDLLTARLEYLKEKNENERKAYAKAQEGKNQPRTRTTGGGYK